MPLVSELLFVDVAPTVPGGLPGHVQHGADL
jgi:hypothetical protein